MKVNTSYENVTRFQTLLEGAGYYPRSYGGRGMNGKYCLGIDLKDVNCLGDFIANIFQSSANNVSHISTIAEAFRSMQTDSMGKGIIVYFTDIEFYKDLD